MVNITDFACCAVHILCFTCLRSVLCFDNKGLLVLSTECEAEGGKEDGGWRREGRVSFDLALCCGERGMVGERALAAAKTATCVLPAVHTQSKLQLAYSSDLHVIQQVFKGLVPTLEINADFFRQAEV